jgi:hypothetical protein
MRIFQLSDHEIPFCYFLQFLLILFVSSNKRIPNSLCAARFPKCSAKLITFNFYDAVQLLFFFPILKFYCYVLHFLPILFVSSNNARWISEFRILFVPHGSRNVPRNLSLLICTTLYNYYSSFPS